MYQLGEVIGRGATGVVHRTMDPTSGRMLAVKVLHPHLVGDAKATSRFIQERHVLSRVSHPNVVQVIELVAEGDQLSIVMELVDGGDLKQLHQRAKPRPSEAVTMMVRIADALAALHAAGVVHRDLKPANVLIEETAQGPEPKITDFGLSRLVEEGMSQSSAAVGTPLYMAPEAVERASTAGPPADVYSLGIMLFELLIGTPPFVGGGTMAILRAHSEEVPPIIEGVPADLQALVRQMLAKEASARPTAAEVRDRLQGVVGRMDDTLPPRAVPDDLLESETVTRMRPMTGVGAGLLGGVGSSGGGSGPSVSGGPRAVLFADPDMTVSGRSPSASLSPSLLVALPERRIGPWPMERVLIAGATALAALVLVGVIVAVKVAGGSDVNPDAFSYAFDPALVDDSGGIASRHWSLSSDGRELTGDLLVSNGGKEPLTLEYVEVLPESVVSDVGDVRFDPRPAELLDDDRAAVLKVDAVDPGARTTFTYTIDLAPGEASLERLTALAQDQIAAEKAFYDKQENADREEPESLDITSLTVTPDTVTLDVGDEQEFVLTGSLADGSPAPPEALTAAAWASGDSSIAAMVRNKVTARAPGATTITAQVGDTTQPVPVLVNQPPNEVASPTVTQDSKKTKTDPSVVIVDPPPPKTEVSVIVDPPKPLPPGGPGQISVNENGLNGVALTWSAPADNGAAIDLYEVRPQGGASKTTSGTTMSFDGLAYATTYKFEARAHNSAGWGPWGGTSSGYLTAEAPGVPSITDLVAAVTDTTANVTFHSSTCTTAYYHGVGSSLEWVSPGWPKAWKNGTNCWFEHGHPFTGLTPATSYTVAIDLHDTGGGSKTVSLTFTTKGEAEVNIAVVDTTSATLTVVASSNLCAVMTVSISPPAAPSSSTGSTCKTGLTATFAGLNPGTQYTVTLSGTVAGKAFLAKTAVGTTKPATVVGNASPDINGDGTVNCADAAILKSDYNTTATRSDLNRDGTVNQDDMSVLLRTLNTTGVVCS